MGHGLVQAPEVDSATLSLNHLWSLVQAATGTVPSLKLLPASIFISTPVLMSNCVAADE